MVNIKPLKISKPKKKYFYQLQPQLLAVAKGECTLASDYFRTGIRRGSINYNIHNYCTRCEEKFLKPIIRCEFCGHKLRTHSINLKNARRLKGDIKYY